MNDINNSLSKTCAICGLPKPLSAFLQLAGPQGTVYGNICAHCRKAQANQPPTPEPEDRTRSSTGFKIDAKAKVQGERDKRSQREHTEEAYKEDREKNKKTRNLIGQRKDKLAKEQKTRIESFLDKRPGEKRKQPPQNIIAERAAKEQKTDYQGPFMDTQIAKIKHQSVFRREFANWIGGGTGIGAAAAKQANQLAQQKKDAKNKETPTSSAEYIRKHGKKL